MDESARRAAILKHVFALARELFEKGADLTYDKTPGPDPEAWDLAEAKVFAGNVRFVAEQLYTISMVFEEVFPIPGGLELTPMSMAFLKSLGVKTATIAERADVARGTVYSQLAALNKTLNREGVAIGKRKVADEKVEG